MTIPPEFEQLVAMLCDHAQRPPRFADLHPTILALADGIEKHDDFAAVASNVNVRPVPALATSVNPNFETVDYTSRHIYLIRFG
ncbi:MAG: hypothetical protein ACYCX6_01095 [Vulcanimicrobiaceae bacterium]